MKKLNYLLILSVLGFTLSYSQENKDQLSSFFKVEGFLDKIGVGYETPISNKLLLDLNAGIGAANIVQPSEFGFKLGKSNGRIYSGVFMKGQVRYYFNRERRKERGHSLINNSGSFIGLQTKYNFNGNKEDLGKVLLTDVHFGQQLPLGSNFIFRYHLGIGYANNFDFNYGTLYPAVNIVFAYKIN